MTQSAVTYKQGDVGREQITDGLQRHRGTLWLGPGTPTEGLWRTTTPPPQPLLVYGQAQCFGNPGAIAAGAYASAQLQLLTETPRWVGIGFNEQGIAGATLYKPAGQTRLHIRDTADVDYEVAGAPGSAQALIGQVVTNGSWTLPATSVWTETPLQVNVTATGAMVRVEFNVAVQCPTKGQRVYVGIMIDGAIPSPGWAHSAVDAPEANYTAALSGTWYGVPAATGVRRVAVGLFGPSGSQLAGAGNIGHSLYITEQRC